ncbi:MAG TPA: hypothetical protein VNJ01_17530 [Bacteriovoracaceae bacterium]|nr:hypothetical protein [Bacteriovoracaceae bacterium]
MLKFILVQGIFLSVINLPLAHSGDCSEKILSYQALKQIAQSKSVTNQLEFLKAIPPDTLQTFTFSFESQSAQGAGVSREFPGVIRTSNDGKVMLRYTCDPSKPTYNKVEVMAFDDASKRFKLVSFDFSKASAPPKHRVQENPRSCLKCHNPGGENAPVDPRPNWASYPNWKGLYGSEDDSFKTYDGSENAALEKQKEDFLSFRLKQKNNPCYSSLPWPKNDPDLLAPYSADRKSEDVSLRPNLQITKTQCVLAANRLARKISEVPEYKYLKYSLAMRSLDCGQWKSGQISSIVPGVKLYDVEERMDLAPIADPRFKESYTTTYQVGKHLGLTDADWSLNFNSPDDPSFRCPITNVPSVYRTNLLVGVGDIASGILLGDLSKELKGLSASVLMSTPEKEDGRGNYSCLDENGGAPNVINKKKACDILAEAQGKLENDQLTLMAVQNLIKEIQQKRSLDCSSDVLGETVSQDLPEIAAVALRLTLSEQKGDPEVGKKIVSTTCKTCHKDGFTGYEFFNDELALKKKLNSTFTQKVLHRLGSDTEPMPPNGNLSPREQLDVLEYLRSFNK